MYKLFFEKLPFYRWPVWLCIFVIFLIMAATVFAWYGFVFRHYGYQPFFHDKIQNIKKSPNRKLLRGLQASWINNPYLEQPRFYEFFEAYLKNNVFEHVNISSNAIVAQYQGDPSSVLPLLGYWRAPAVYFHFSTIHLQCKQNEVCNIGLSLQLNDQVLKKSADPLKVSPVLKHYFSQKADQPAKLSGDSIYQLHLLAYFHRGARASALVGDQLASTTVHVGDILGAEHAKVAAIHSERIVLKYNDLAGGGKTAVAALRFS